jgi:peptidoglycan pentaglycine glycine transferase (the first glycine)
MKAIEQIIDYKVKPVENLRLRISEEENDPEWDAFLALSAGGDHVQTSMWGQVKRTMGWKPARVMLLEGDQITAGAQLLYKPVASLVNVGYVTKGPVGVADNPAIARLLINKLHKVCKAHLVQYLIVQPPNNDQHLCSMLPTLGFRVAPTVTTPTASVMIDLSLDEETLLRNMKRQLRQNIRRADREEIQVRAGNRGDLDAFFHHYQMTSQRQGFIPYPKEYFEKMWDVLDRKGNIGLIMAEREGESISGLLIISFGDTVVAKLFGWSGQYKSSRPNEAVFWGAIKWAKAHGYRFLDLLGIEPEGAKAVLDGQPLSDALLHSSTFMKLQFGGQICLFPPAFEYIYNPLIRWSYNLLLPTLRKSGVITYIRHRTQKNKTKVTSRGDYEERFD